MKLIEAVNRHDSSNLLIDDAMHYTVEDVYSLVKHYSSMGGYNIIAADKKTYNELKKHQSERTSVLMSGGAIAGLRYGSKDDGVDGLFLCIVDKARYITGMIMMSELKRCGNGKAVILVGELS